MSYPGHSLGGGSYPSAEKQSVYSTAPADWATCDWSSNSLTTVLHCSRIVITSQGLPGEFEYSSIFYCLIDKKLLKKQYTNKLVDKSIFFRLMYSLTGILSDFISISQMEYTGWLVGFYGISTFAGYLTPNPFYVIKFYLKQFSLA